jgi:hypothetical protein
MVGWDLGAAMQLCEALGYCRITAAEMLPALEQVRVRKFNEGINS